MARKQYDPLAFVPPPDAIRAKLRDTLTLADRLRRLLDLAERIHVPLTTADSLLRPAEPQGVSRD